MTVLLEMFYSHGIHRTHGKIKFEKFGVNLSVFSVDSVAISKITICKR
jgi:hypothetical protein